MNRRDRRARQSRRRRRYQLPIERRAVVAAGMIKQNGWTLQQASGLLCVNPGYVALVKGLNESDHHKLIRGEIRLSDLWRDYRRGLTERRAQRQAEEREARVQAEREEQVRAVDNVLESVGFDHIVDRAVAHFGPELLIEELDLCLQRSGRDLGQVITRVIEPDRILRMLDNITTPQLPQLVAAE
jgi:hypothetical protein